MPAYKTELITDTKNVMSVPVPVISVKEGDIRDFTRILSPR